MKKICLSVLAVTAFSLIQANAQNSVTGIYTDFGGYWYSAQGAINSVQPNNSHNLLAFTAGSTTYSTGVNDAALTANGLTTFSAQEYQALPISGLPAPNSGSSNPTVIGVGSQYGGGDGNVSPIPVTNNMSQYLTDGGQGLDLGTGVYNLPSGSELLYTVSTLNAGAIGGAPDLVVTQIGAPSPASDVLRFYDAAGNTVGNVVSIVVAGLPVVGQTHMKFYNPTNPPTYNAGLYGARDLRLVTFDLSDFGITPGNIGSVVGFGQALSGTSDPAFIAYNSAAVTLDQPVTGTIFDDPDGGTPSGPGYTGGATLELLDAGNNVIATTTTNASGQYTFLNITPGNYTVRLTIPTGYVITGASDGNTDNVIPVSVSNSPAVADFGLGNTATPVTLLNFNAYKKEHTTILVWATAKEQDNRGFEVERSGNGSSWTTIGFVAGNSENGNSSVKLDYAYTDNAPMDGRNFYRLKQTDNNGSYAYSDVQMVSFGKSTAIDIYPNPATGSVSLSGLKGHEGIYVYDVAGRLVHQARAENAMVQIPLAKLSAGIYHIKVIDRDGNTSAYKVVKSK